MTLRWRLFPKYATLIIALVGGILVASAAISLYFSYRENQDHLVALQFEKAQAAATRIEQYILDIEHQLGWTALPGMDAAGLSIEQRRIDYLKLLRQAPAITEVAWIDPAGREQLRVSRLAMDAVSGGIDLSHEPKFQVAKGGKTYYSPVYFRKETEPYMTIARPAGSGGGVTATDVNLKFVWEVVSRIKIGREGVAYAIDSTGTLIAHPDISLVLKKTDLRTLPQVAALANGGGGAISPRMQNLKGEEVLAAHAPIPTLKWTVFVESPRAEAFAPLYDTIARLALLLAAGLLVSMTASFFLARALVRPIEALRDGAARIGSGELDQRIDVKTGDELEGLAEQFNRMGADLQASYADLERKVEERTAELTESLEYQTAISDVLRVISQSPTDVTPVFEAIQDSALRLFGSSTAGAFRYDGRLVHLVATRNLSPEAIEQLGAHYPAPPNPHLMSGRVILAGCAVSIEDTLADPDYDQTTANVGKWRRIVGAPLLKDGVPIGALVVAWTDPGKTPKRQQDLLQTFADQAVIAIENVRLINETKEALEQQTATAEVLQVISSSPTDVQPVFDAIAERAMTLCDAHIGGVARFDGDLVHLVAYHGISPEASAAMLERFPMKPGRGSATARAILEAAPVQIPDVMEDPDYALKEEARSAGYHANLAVPMLREGQVIGSLNVCREEPGPFPEKQVRLLQTFADQAVIAIENVRLFNETREALEQQTATSEVLGVISSSHTDLEPVFDSILRNATQLCEAHFGLLGLYDGEKYRTVAQCGANAEFAKWVFERGAFALVPGGPLMRMVEERQPVHIADLKESPAYLERRPMTVPMVELGGVRTYLAVPLMKDGRVIGGITIYRPDVRPFTPKQIGLVSMFASQAVIAIENVRLFNETKEALERQTATGEILRVISGSITDTQPVFDAIVRNCQRLFGGREVALVMPSGAMLKTVAFASEGKVNGEGEFKPWPLDRDSAGGACILDSRVIAVPDIALALHTYPRLKQLALPLGYRSALFVPLMREGKAIACLAILRASAGEFSDKEILLASTFADQAVIGIENVRLFNETTEALEQQTATAEILKVISASPTDVQPVFDAVAANAARVCGVDDATIHRLEDGGLTRVAHFGSVPVLADRRLPLLPGGVNQRVLAERRTVHIPDTWAASFASEFPGSRHAAMGVRALLATPLVRDGVAVGLIQLRRADPRPFTGKQIELLETFADQAVIAIENVRLFNETKEALEQQTATAEILQVISNSVADTTPVFDKILDSCRHLFESDDMGIILVGDDGQLHLAASQGATGDEIQKIFPVPVADSATELAIHDRQVLHFPDVLGEHDVPETLRHVTERLGIRSIVMAPMLWEERGVGSVYVARARPGPFSEKDIGLLKTFADQAVIAIQNSRLFNEIQSKSRELEMANKHKSEFLANMSHELRTPLNAIIGFSEVLTEKMFGDLNEKQLDYLQDIHSSGHHLLSLINDILDLSKIEAGRMELDLSRFDLGMLLDNSTTLVRERASRHGLSLSLDVDDAVGEWVADERKVKQVVVNLLSNAVKFTPAGGGVTLRARRVNGSVEIAVIDTGVGIALNEQAVVFEEFRQASGDYLRKSEGTGLGLALAKRFVELHGGSIRVESVPGKGSTFAFILPARVLEAT